MIRVSAVLVALAAPASGQELNYSDDASIACANGAADAAARRACIGRSADMCMRTSAGGDTTVGMTGCLDRELALWDRVLNENYRLAKIKAQRFDQENAGAPGGASLENALRQMQLAWIGYRDRTCDFEMAQWGGGTGGNPALTGCLMRETGEQALYLYDAWLAQ